MKLELRIKRFSILLLLGLITFLGGCGEVSFEESTSINKDSNIIKEDIKDIDNMSKKNIQSSELELASNYDLDTLYNIYTNGTLEPILLNEQGLLKIEKLLNEGKVISKFQLINFIDLGDFSSEDKAKAENIKNRLMKEIKDEIMNDIEKDLSINEDIKPSLKEKINEYINNPEVSLRELNYLARSINLHSKTNKEIKNKIRYEIDNLEKFNYETLKNNIKNIYRNNTIEGIRKTFYREGYGKETEKRFEDFLEGIRKTFYREGYGKETEKRFEDFLNNINERIRKGEYDKKIKQVKNYIKEETEIEMDNYNCNENIDIEYNSKISISKIKEFLNKIKNGNIYIIRDPIYIGVPGVMIDRVMNNYEDPFTSIYLLDNLNGEDVAIPVSDITSMYLYSKIKGNSYIPYKEYMINEGYGYHPIYIKDNGKKYKIVGRGWHTRNGECFSLKESEDLNLNILDNPTNYIISEVEAMLYTVNEDFNDLYTNYHYYKEIFNNPYGWFSLKDNKEYSKIVKEINDLYKNSFNISIYNDFKYEFK